MSWRPRTLRAQLVLLILGALLAAQAVSLWLFFDERGLAVRAALALEAAGRAANVALLLDEAPEALHPSILRAADSPLVRFGAGLRLCCANGLRGGVPLSPDGLILQAP